MWDVIVTQWLPLLAAVLTLVVSITVGVQAFRRRASLEEDLDTLRKADTRAAIASADLKTLGFHLVERLGGASVHNYVVDDEVRGDVDRALGAVRSYLDAGESDAPESLSADRVESEAARESDAAPRVDRALDAALRWGLETSDTWTVLARARRDLESVLATVLDFPEGIRRPPLAQMLAIAQERAQISREQVAELRRAIDLANKAIHGIDVPAESALNAADVIVDFIGRVTRLEDFRPRRETHVVEAHVRPRTGGGWIVIGPGKPSDERYETQRAAIDAARDLLWERGGGQVVVHGREGRIEGSDTVASKKSASDYPKRRGRNSGPGE